jgi:3-methyladenine DNA glycosylase AlkD
MPAVEHVDTLVTSLRTALAAEGDPERAVQQQRYMKSAMPFRGIGLPRVRTIVRGVLDDPAHRPGSAAEWEATVRRLWDEASYREERYAALTVARHRSARAWRTPAVLPLYRHLVVTGAWWDLVDETAGDLVAPLLRASRTEVTPTVLAWAEDEDLWLRRAAILSQLGAKAETDTALLETVLTANLEGSRHGSEFFVRKAIGWALRDYARTDPDWVRGFLARHHARLSGLSRREASKHL